MLPAGAAMADDRRPRVLFLCTGNSCRSQMAEGFAKAMHGDAMDACSAGTSPQVLNRLAVRAMAEVGIDISGQVSKGIEACDPATLDLVVTVCGDADETCPTFWGRARVVHRGFEDPPRLAADAVDDEAAMVHYRRVRDEIGEFVRTLGEVVREIRRAGE